MNHTHIKWPIGVTTDAPVLAEHDVSMAMRSFDLLVFKQKQLRLRNVQTQAAPTTSAHRGSIMSACGARRRGTHLQTQQLFPSRLLQHSMLSSYV